MINATKKKMSQVKAALATGDSGTLDEVLKKHQMSHGTYYKYKDAIDTPTKRAYKKRKKSAAPFVETIHTPHTQKQKLVAIIGDADAIADVLKGLN